MRKIISVIFSLLITSGLFAQRIKDEGETDFKVSLNSFASTGDDLPFWLKSNRNGVIAMKGTNYQLIQAGFAREYIEDSSDNLDFTWGANVVYGLGAKTDLQANEYWGGIRYNWLRIGAGAKADPILYGGLSSTNGNIDQSNNARPLPGVSISSNDFIPVFFWKKWFSMKGVYEEKFLLDHMYVKNAHLHHKALYGRALLRNDWSLTGGIEHFVLWGGTSPEYGVMPGWSQYYRYILDLPGGPGSYIDDQKNKAGNQLGNYSLEIKKSWRRSSLAFYWNHLFEDQSGIEMQNWCDGLYGLHYNNQDRKAVVTDIVYEFMYTLNQSGPNVRVPSPTPENPNRVTGRGRDSYFDHFIYRSFSYYNRMMGTPLFVPQIGADGVANGFESTRMWMHHLGIKGVWGSEIFWKTMVTYSRNFGTYANSFPTWGVVYPVPLDELSFLCEFNYRARKSPYQLNFGVAGDYGKRFTNTIGGYAGISYQF